MNAQISFTADETLKKKAAQKAKQKGITLKTLFVVSMEAFVNDKFDVGIIPGSSGDVTELQFNDDELVTHAGRLNKLLS